MTTNLRSIPTLKYSSKLTTSCRLEIYSSPEWCRTVSKYTHINYTFEHDITEPRNTYSEKHGACHTRRLSRNARLSRLLLIITAGEKLPIVIALLQHSVMTRESPLFSQGLYRRPARRIVIYDEIMLRTAIELIIQFSRRFRYDKS